MAQHKNKIKMVGEEKNPVYLVVNFVKKGKSFFVFIFSAFCGDHTRYNYPPLYTHQINNNTQIMAKQTSRKHRACKHT